jgi:hypothetical protein
MERRLAMAAMLSAALLVALPAAATPAIPVRTRIIKGSRQGSAAFDPRLEDLKSQLGHLAYVRWEQVGEHRFDMDFGKAVELPLPSGDKLVIVILESRKDSVTVEVRVPAQKTQSRLTIAKDKRIVHQVTPERGGDAYFVTIRPWP